jgi:hypothetical protein
MFFGKKSKKESMKCDNCSSRISEDYSFCPYCGNILFDPQKRANDFGMLGKSDAFDDSQARNQIANNNLTITDRVISTLMNSLMKNIEQQFNEPNKSNQTRGIPKNIKINIGIANPNSAQMQKRTPRHDFSMNKISPEQLEKISSLPKTAAKAHVKRLGDKVLYQLDAPGIESIKDIFVSKLESGYEIKALAKNKVYVNSLPVNLPINSFTLDKEKLLIEFFQQQ